MYIVLQTAFQTLFEAHIVTVYRVEKVMCSEKGICTYYTVFFYYICRIDDYKDEWWLLKKVSTKQYTRKYIYIFQVHIGNSLHSIFKKEYSYICHHHHDQKRSYRRPGGVFFSVVNGREVYWS